MRSNPDAAGGWVELNRVNGNLALSRAFGDFLFKKNSEKSAAEQIITGVLNNGISYIFQYIFIQERYVFYFMFLLLFEKKFKQQN